MSKCKDCGEKVSFLKIDLISGLCEKCKKEQAKKEKAVTLKKSVQKQEEQEREMKKKQEEQRKNFTNEGDKIIKQKTDYPVMQALAKYFNFIAILNAIGGVFIAVFSLINGEIVLFFAGLILGGIFWAISMFFSELMKISADIADNVKAIKHSLEK